MEKCFNRAMAESNSVVVISYEELKDKNVEVVDFLKSRGLQCLIDPLPISQQQVLVINSYDDVVVCGREDFYKNYISFK